MFWLCLFGAGLSVVFGRASLSGGTDAVPFVVLACVFVVGAVLAVFRK